MLPGTIPTSISSLTRLRSLAVASFSTIIRPFLLTAGILPASSGIIDGFDMTAYFCLGALRGISGTLPSTPGSVEVLISAGEAISGSLSGSFKALETLFLLSSDPAVAAFSGCLPNILGGSGGFKSLVLLNQAISGTFPAFKSSTNFTSIFGQQLNLTLPEPSSFGEYTLISGTFPQSAEIPNLKVAAMAKWRLSGTVPDVLALSLLQAFWLDSNRLSGAIQRPQIVPLNHSLKSFSLAENRLSGEWPDKLGKYYRLTYISMRDNSLHGTINQDIGLLTAMKHLFIFNNGISGTLPDSFGSMSKISNFMVTH